MTLSTPVRNTLLLVVFLGLLVNAVALILYLSSARSASATPDADLTRNDSAPAAVTDPPRASSLSFTPLPSGAVSGACLAWDGFARGQMGFDQAKVLLLSGPLRNKSWTLQSGSGPRWQLTAPSTEGLAIVLGQARFPAPEAKRSSRLIWTFQTQTEAREAFEELSARGVNATVSELPPSPPERRVAILPQGPNEIAYARSLIERMPGSGLSAIACPEVAAPLLTAAR